MSLPPVARPVRVLIADDHPIFREGLKMFLGAAPGIEVVGEAADGEQAINMVAELRPDIVLLDVAMPVVPGLVVLQSLAVLNTGIRVLLLTASIERGERLRALQLGARGVVLKARTSDVLLKAIHAILAAIFTRPSYVFPDPLPFRDLGHDGFVTLGGASLQIRSFFVIAFAIALAVAARLALEHTRFGRGLQAIAADAEGAQIVGVPVDR